jgi:hypothetical protein
VLDEVATKCAQTVAPASKNREVVAAGSHRAGDLGTNPRLPDDAPVTST